ncbi:MAG: DNA recombination protein RmuC [Flavobacteriales bacterium]|nr:DNA recombination protein RmuC [Flavobacteriales bacterium]MCX7768062.1 DNA recombination protein RmuC [Flavobacteriales bacterium]MDW8409267.1 DNA recombination protein RmuC [Flavobacteriales bacterium]
METLIPLLLGIILLIQILILWRISRYQAGSSNEALRLMEERITQQQHTLRQDVLTLSGQQRQELVNMLTLQGQQMREELGRQNELLTQNLQQLHSAFQNLSNSLHQLLTEQRNTLQEAFAASRDEVNARLRENRTEQNQQLEGIQRAVQERLNNNIEAINHFRTEINTSLQNLQNTVDSHLQQISKTTEERLEQMRQTVDQKLQETLHNRLTESFQLVSQQLEQVHKGLGEMQALASNVGDLKKVLSNVKTRGILGEVQLGNIFEQILSPEQYAQNVRVNPESRETVEYAVKLPGRQEDKPVWLPVDSKFPLEVYQRLLDAQESGDMEDIRKARQELGAILLRNATDIRQKYICPPHTTDFAILFLPTEGLYAEALQNLEVVDRIQRELRLIIAGPTTLAAILNSLQMGFRTLAIEKRSAEVWKILSAVKSEFGKFRDMLLKVRKKVEEAGTELDKLITTRTQQVERRLRHVEALPEAQAQLVLYEEPEGPAEASSPSQVLTDRQGNS